MKKNILHSETKLEHMKMLSDYRNSIIKHPPLKILFLELTLRCNEHCLHCGSRCGDHLSPEELSLSQYKKILNEVRSDFDISDLKLDITGGEPLLRKDFFEIMSYANKLGYKWGMTSNGILIDDNTAKKLKDCGMRTISISIDGLEQTHDRLRGKKGSFSAAMKGIDALVKNGGFENIQITTIVNHFNINELPELFELMKSLDINSWRVANIEPIGRARQHPELLLNNDEYIYMLDFIREKRAVGYPVLYGCNHFLGPEYEREVRPWYFLCNAGLYLASITSNGEIRACLDIERRPELVQGNILNDRFKTVWENKFKIFRENLSCKNSTCASCKYEDFCHGGGYHSWDYDNNKPMICFKDVLF